MKPELYPTQASADAARAAVFAVRDDAAERLDHAISLPTRDDAQEDKLRALLVALYAAYPEFLATSPPDGEALLRQAVALDRG